MVASVFDPLGFLACITLIPKLILQEIWKVGKDNEKKIGWDDHLPVHIQALWDAFAKGLCQLESLHIVRSLRPFRYQMSGTKFQLHIFVDASLRGYSAVVYLRAEWNQEVSVAFVTARARVSPVRQLTVPRLELLEAVMGYRLGVRVEQTLKGNVSALVWLTDSTTVLHWLKTKAATYSQFVACRRKEILEGSCFSQWTHVPGELNPADEESRGLDAVKLHPKHRWFLGLSKTTRRRLAARRRWPL